MQTAEIVSTVGCTLWRLTWQCDAHYGVMHTMEILSYCVFLTPEKFKTIDSAVWCTPESDLAVKCTLCRLNKLCDAHRGDRIRGGMHTAVFLKIWNTGLQGVMHIAESDLTVCITPWRLTPRCDANRRAELWIQIRVHWIWIQIHDFGTIWIRIQVYTINFERKN